MFVDCFFLSIGNGLRGFNLPASHVIHTVGPIYNAEKNPKKLLESAYK